MKLNSKIAGLSTNVQFLMSLCAHPELLEGNVHTGFIEEHKNTLLAKMPPNSELISQVNINLDFIKNYYNILFYCFRQLLH